MSKYNIRKARSRLKAAEDELLRDEILSDSKSYQTTKELLDDLENETGWKKAHFAKYTGYSLSGVINWYNNNKNTVVVKCVCDCIKRKYWHERNKERYAFGFDEGE
jgi:hypothetical protein